MDEAELSAADRVALLLDGSVDYVAAVLALLHRGLFPIPLDPRLTVGELGPLLTDLRPAAVVRDGDDLAHVLSKVATLPAAAVPLGRPIHVTSGTTGRPKGVYSGLLDLEQAAALVREERELWGFTSTDVNLVLSPLHHSAPLRFATGTLQAGGRVVVPGRFDPALVTQAILEHRPTSMFCVPAHLQKLFGHWEEHGTPDLSCFRLVAHAGAPCPEHLKRRLIELFPVGSTWEFYGSTEGQFTACRSEEWGRRPGTVGRARPGRELSVDEAGHLWCKVPAYARFSYFNAPDKTAAAWRGEWFTVGDLGRLEEGYLYLDGRREDLIISGGINVYPAEVESVLSAVAGVDDVAVVGIDDERWGQRVVSAYVGTATAAELEAVARAQLAPPKRPKQHIRIDALPRTATGKIRRLDLPALLAEQRQQA